MDFLHSSHNSNVVVGDAGGKEICRVAQRGCRKKLVNGGESETVRMGVRGKCKWMSSERSENNKMWKSIKNT